ncbi:hypothetical protein CRENBAI_016538 [Crenichthys baileyi]|uniref:Uncharacterized protein n=1 Tax=Crenichthys baileyi TaxID=28760 RepID=A0AAV9S6T7_9TELE
MKILAVFILVFLTGCNGGHHEHPSQFQAELVQDAYWRYVQKSTSTPWEYVEDIRYSPPGQYLCSLIAESIEIIYNFFCNVYTHILWWTNNFYRKFCHEVDHLKHDLEHFLLYLEADLHYHAKELAAQTRSKLEELKECAAHYIEALDPKGLKIALLEKTQELHEHVHESLEEFKVTIFSLVYRFEVKLTRTTYSLNKKIVPRRRRHWGKLNKASDSLKNDLEHLWEDWAKSQKRTTE